MLWMLRKPSPATVIAIAAFVIVSSGVAIGSVAARDGKITACYAKRNGTLRLIDADKKCRKSEKRIAWNQRGPRGRRGPAGEDGFDGLDGLDGFDGLDGLDGADAASMLTGSVDASAGGEAFAFPSGADVSTGVESAHITLSPAVDTVARDLAVKLNPEAPDPGTAEFRFVIRDDGADTQVSCSMSGNQRSCDSGSATATLSAGSELTLEHSQIGQAPGDAREFSFGWRATTP